MNIIKGLIYFMLIIMGAVLLAALFAPTSQQVKRQISINAPVAVVFDQVYNPKKWDKWDVWYMQDSSQSRQYKGTIGDKKYGFFWKSKQDENPTGSMYIVKNIENEQLEYILKIGRLEGAGDLKFDEQNGETVVTWSLTSEQSYPFTLLNYFLDKRIGPDMMMSLANLKSYLESTNMEELVGSNISIQIVEEYGVNYVMIKVDNMPMNELETFFQQSYNQLYAYAETNGLSPKGPPCGLFYTWDENKKQTSLAAAIPISSMEMKTDTTIEISSGIANIGSQYIASTMSGGYSQSSLTHTALGKWVEDNGKKIEMPVIEEYVKGPLQTLDSSKYVTRVIYYFE